MTTPSVDGLEVVDLEADDLPEAVGVLARGMRDNPMHVAVFGDDPEERRRTIERLFGALFEVMVAQQPIAVRQAGSLVAATGVAPAGACQPTPRQGIALAPALLAAGPRSAVRAMRWMRAWGARDPEERHVHLGPLAVDAHRQGQGIGSRLLTEHCRRLDATGEVGYLETDRPENVAFYERQGFEVVDQADVVGVACWFMRRPPRATGESR